MLCNCNKIFEDTLSLRVAHNGTSMPVIANTMSAKQEPVAPQCLLKLLSQLHNMIHVFYKFRKYLILFIQIILNQIDRN